jgi:hypothetical protein
MMCRVLPFGPPRSWPKVHLITHTILGHGFLLELPGRRPAPIVVKWHFFDGSVYGFAKSYSVDRYKYHFITTMWMG